MLLLEGKVFPREKKGKGEWKVMRREGGRGGGWLLKGKGKRNQNEEVRKRS